MGWCYRAVGTGWIGDKATSVKGQGKVQRQPGKLRAAGGYGHYHLRMQETFCSNYIIWDLLPSAALLCATTCTGPRSPTRATEGARCPGNKGTRGSLAGSFDKASVANITSSIGCNGLQPTLTASRALGLGSLLGCGRRGRVLDGRARVVGGVEELVRAVAVGLLELLLGGMSERVGEWVREVR